MDTSKNLAILNANIMDGLYLPFSKDPTVCLDTSRAFASSSCVIPFAFRISSSLFLTFNHLSRWKVYFTYNIIIFKQNVKLTFHLEPKIPEPFDGTPVCLTQIKLCNANLHLFQTNIFCSSSATFSSKFPF